MRAAATVLLLVLTACDAPPAPAPKPAPVVAPAPVAPPVPPPVPPPAEVAPPVDPAPPVEPPLAGVGPSGAEGRAAREQAVVDLLTDGRSAAALELLAAGPGRAFDPELADKMTPIVYTTSRIPQIYQRTARVEGPIDRDIVRRIVRAHINEVRYCYNKALAVDPNTSGRMVIEFEILDTGKVGAAAIHRSTVSDPQVAECTVAAVRRWTFPKPEKTAKVLYPFDLEPG